MAVTEELPLDAPELADALEPGQLVRVYYTGAGDKYRGVRVLSVEKTENPALECDRIRIRAQVQAVCEMVTIYADEDGDEYGELFVDDGDADGQRLQRVRTVDHDDVGADLRTDGGLDERDSANQDRLYWGFFSICFGLLAATRSPYPGAVLSQAVAVLMIVYGVYSALTVFGLPTVMEVLSN